MNDLNVLPAIAPNPPSPTFRLRMASEESSSASGGGATAAEAVPPDGDSEGDSGVSSAASGTVGGGGDKEGQEKEGDAAAVEEVMKATDESERLRLTAEKLKLQVWICLCMEVNRRSHVLKFARNEGVRTVLCKSPRLERGP